MKHYSRYISYAFRLLSLVMLLSACGGGGGGGGNNGGGGGGNNSAGNNSTGNSSGNNSTGNSSTPQAVAINILPTSITVTALATHQFQATVTNSTNAQVNYAIQEGASGGSINSSGLYTAPAAAGIYHVIATSAADTTKTATSQVTVVALPVISSFTATDAAVAEGNTAALTAVFSGGTGVIDQNMGAATSGIAKSSSALNADTTFTLSVANSLGATVTAQVTVAVVTTKPTVSSFLATPAVITQGKPSTLEWVVSGKGITSVSIDSGVGSVSASGSKAVTPNGATIYTLTATNLKGSATATATVSVVFAPVISSFMALPTTVTAGSLSTLTPKFSLGTGVISAGIGAVASGTDYSTGAIASETTYMLTVTNVAGDSVSKSLTVHVDPGTFGAAGGTMTTPRHFHTSALLPNGKVLVAGGSGNSGFLATAEEFDPTANGGAGEFSATAGNMSEVRGYASSVLLPNGKVMIIGGLNANSFPNNYSNTVDLYDPQTRTFTSSTNSLAEARIQCSATLLASGKVLIAGGNNATTTHIGTAELYDPVTDTFTPTAGNMGTARWGHHARLLTNGKVLIVGGTGSLGTGSAELYDPQTNSFLPTGNSATNASWATMTSLQSGQVLLALSGSAGAGATLYDPISGLGLVTGSALLTRYSAPTATLLADGRVLIAGDSGAPGAEVPADAEIYAPSTGQFTYTGNLGKRGQQTAHLLPTGKVVLIGGFSYSTQSMPGFVLDTASLYDAGPAIAAPTPNALITAPASVNQSATGEIASVPSTANARYFWIVAGGTINSGQGTSAITFTAGTGGTLTLHCLVISPAGIPGHGQASVNLL